MEIKRYSTTTRVSSFLSLTRASSLSNRCAMIGDALPETVRPFHNCPNRACSIRGSVTMIPTATALYYLLVVQALLEPSPLRGLWIRRLPGAFATPVVPLFTASGAVGRLRQYAVDRVAADFRGRIAFATGQRKNLNTAYRNDSKTHRVSLN